MSESKNFSVDIIVNKVNLHHLNDVDYRDTDRDRNLLIEIQFDDIKFDVTCREILTNKFCDGRSIDFTATTRELYSKLRDNPIKVFVYEKDKESINILGEVSCTWPKTLVDGIDGGNLWSVPFCEECEIKLNENVVGNLCLAVAFHEKCDDSIALKQIDNLRLDESGNLEVYNSFKNSIDEKDIFFVVGSNSNSTQQSRTQLVNFGTENKQPSLRLNTRRFESLKGSIVPNFDVVGNKCWKIPSLNLDPEEITDALDRRSLHAKRDSIVQDSEGEGQEKASFNEFQIETNGKPYVTYEDHCNRLPLSSDDNIPEKHYQPTFEGYFNATFCSEEEAENKPKYFPIISKRLCTSCRQDITYQPDNTPCHNCGYKPNPTKTPDPLVAKDEIIAEDWGENELTFIKNQGFSKYDHCTCEKDAPVLCIYCKINRIRKNESSIDCRYYVKEDLKKKQDEVENVFNEVLGGKPVRKSIEHDQKIIPEDVPKLSKMLDWLKVNCSGKMREQLGHIFQTKAALARTPRMQGGAEGRRKLENGHRLSGAKENKNMTNNAKKNSKAGGTMSQRTSYYYESGKIQKDDMKKLVNMKFDEEDEDKAMYTDQHLKRDSGLKKELNPKLRSAIDKLCRYEAEMEWYKPPKPLTKKDYIRKIKRKYGRKYSYSNQLRPVSALGRHQCCLKNEKLVPRKMGWLWNLHSPEVQKGWRPGRLRRSVRELMQYFLPDYPLDTLPTTAQIGAMRRCLAVKKPSEDLTQRPTLQIKKENNQYLVTMNPLKDAKAIQKCANPYANVKPIQLKITKNSLNIKRAQVKRYLKKMGFVKCECSHPIATCVCRSYMEKQRLESTVKSLEPLLQMNNLRNTIALSDTTDSESQFNVDFTPPAGLIKPHLRGKMVESQATQYDENDYTAKKRVHTSEMVLKERKLKALKRQNGLIHKQEKSRVQSADDTMNRKHLSDNRQSDNLNKNEENIRRNTQFSDHKQGATIIKGNQKLPKLTENPTSRKDTLQLPDKSANANQLQNPKNKMKSDKEPNETKEKSLHTKSRLRGGANILPREETNQQKHHRVHEVQCNLNKIEDPKFEGVRISKPIDRWERYRRKLPTRPPWDDSLYVPPPMKSPPRSQAATQTNRLQQHGRSSPKRNYLLKSRKNLQNQQMARFTEQANKATNTENIQEAQKTKDATAVKKGCKSTYHKLCMNRVAPIKEPNRPIAAC